MMSESESNTLHWKKLPPKKGLERLWHGMCAAVVGHKVFCLGGMELGTHRHEMKVHVVDSAHEFAWSTLQPQGKRPGPRRNHSCWLHEDKIYIYGGDVILNGLSTSYSDLWCYDAPLNAFAEVKPLGEELGLRSFMSAGYIEAMEICVIYGGLGTRQEAGRPRCLDMRTLTCYVPKFVGKGPRGRERHGTCVVGKTIYMVGGFNLENDGKLLVMLHCEKRKVLRWSEPKVTQLSQSIPIRYNCTLTALGKRLFYLGGCNSETDETCYYFSIESRRWVKVRQAGDVPNTHSHLSVCANGTIFCYGGFMRDGNHVFLLE